MKIIEIVDTTINEASPWSSIAKYVTGLGAKALNVGQRKALIDKFAGRYPPDYIMKRSDLKRIEKEFPGEDPNDVAKEILQRSSTVRNWGAVQQNVARTSARWAQIKNIIGGLKSLWTPLIGIELATILWEPFSHYSDRMDLADQWLNAKNESERWTQEQYNQFHHSELMALIEKLARLFITYKVLKLPGRALNIFGKNFGNAFNQLTTPARLWLADELASSKEFSEFLPILMVEEALGKQYVTNAVGKYLVGQAEGYVFDRIAQAEQGKQDKQQGAPQQGVAKPAPTTPSSSTTTDTQQPTTTQEPVKTTQKSTLELLKPYNPEDWEYYSQQLVKHKPTGTYHSKAVVDRFK